MWNKKTLSQGLMLTFVLPMSACSSMSQTAAPIIHHNSPPSSVLAAQIAANQTPTVPNPTPIQSVPVQTAPASTPIVTTPIVTTPIVTTPVVTPQIVATPLPPQPATPAPSIAPMVPSLPASEELPPELYTVQAGDNLFRIALNNGLGYRELAALNNIENPDDIKVGQVLRIRTAAEMQAIRAGHTRMPPVSTPPAVAKVEKAAETAIKAAENAAKSTENAAKIAQNTLKQAQNNVTEQTVTAPVVAAPIVAATIAKTAENAAKSAESAAKIAENTAKIAQTMIADAPAPSVNASGWRWPIKGKILSPFTEQNKGIDIAGNEGQAVYAAKAGRVVYSGSGLRGYGNLLIIKHDETFLTAYAHNKRLLAKEGDTVQSGQKIAEVGKTDTNQFKLHFEVRRFGKPVDPMTYLGKP